MRALKGIVTSTKMAKTLVVTIHTYKAHPKYKKRFKTSKKYYVHNEEGKYKDGDVVTIYESRPMSRLKRWTVTKESLKNH